MATLSTVQMTSEEEIHVALWEVVRTGLVLRLDGAHAFLHDRVLFCRWRDPRLQWLRSKRRIHAGRCRFRLCESVHDRCPDGFRQQAAAGAGAIVARLKGV